LDAKPDGARAAVSRQPPPVLPTPESQPDPPPPPPPPPTPPQQRQRALPEEASVVRSVAEKEPRPHVAVHHLPVQLAPLQEPAPPADKAPLAPDPSQQMLLRLLLPAERSIAAVGSASPHVSLLGTPVPGSSSSSSDKRLHVESGPTWRHTAVGGGAAAAVAEAPRMQCVVCWERPVSVHLAPCGHMCLCRCVKSPQSSCRMI